MHLVIERDVLVGALKPVVAIAGKGSTIPILSCVLIRAEAGEVTLSASNLMQEARFRVAVDVDTPGVVAVDAHTLSDLVARLPEGSQVELKQVSEVRLRVAAGRAVANLPLADADGFPAYEDVRAEPWALEPSDLAAALDAVSFAVATDTTRYYLNGVYLHGHGNGLRAVATDGHRLARVALGAPAMAGVAGVILPREFLPSLRRQLDGLAQPVTMRLSGSRAVFTFGDLVYATRLVDGTYPDYDRVVPLNNDIRVIVGRAALVEAVRRVIVVAGSEKTRAIKFSLDPGRVTLRATSPEGGDATEDLDAEIQGLARSLDVGFNSAYLLDVLGSFGGLGRIEARLDGAAGPTVWAEPGAGEVHSAARIAVLMPMRV